MKKVLILGAAGFLGQHMEYRLKERGDFVVSIVRSYPKYRKSVADETNVLDLTNPPDFHHHFFRHHFDEIYQLAAEVGGQGYIGTGIHDADILTNSLKINLHTLDAIRKTQAADRIFFASSECVYPAKFEVDPFANEREAPEPGLYREHEADFDNNYAFGKEKLYAEALYQAYAIRYGITARIGRLSNTYGPYCTWDGDRAKSVAAICRKVADAPYAGVVDIWGDATQKRSFTYVDDAVEGILRVMNGNLTGPVNIAHSQLYTIKDLFETVCKVAGKVLGFKSVDGPIGPTVRGSHNGLLRAAYQWEPAISLEEGLAKTYPWIAEQVLTKSVA